MGRSPAGAGGADQSDKFKSRKSEVMFLKEFLQRSEKVTQYSINIYS